MIYPDEFDPNLIDATIKGREEVGADLTVQYCPNPANVVHPSGSMILVTGPV